MKKIWMMMVCVCVVCGGCAGDMDLADTESSEPKTQHNGTEINHAILENTEENNITSETVFELVPPGTLPDVSSIPQPDQSEVTSIGTYSFDIFDITSFAYFYNQKSKEERLVLVEGGAGKYAQLLILETDFKGAAGLKSALDEIFQAKLLACKNISFEEGQYAYNASLAVGCANEERIDLKSEFKNETDNQMYFGNVRPSYPKYPSDAIVTELNSGRFVMIATNVNEEGSEGLQENKEIYERIFERFGLEEIISVE